MKGKFKEKAKALILKSGRLRSRKFNFLNVNEIDFEKRTVKRRLKRLLEHLDFIIEEIKKNETLGTLSEREDSLDYLERTKEEIKEAIKSKEYTSYYLEGLVDYYHWIEEMVKEINEEESYLTEIQKFIEEITEKEPEDFVQDRRDADIYSEEYLKVDKDIRKKYEDYTFPIIEKEKTSCEGYIAPEGWKFQDCEYDFVSILRIKDGDWSISWDMDREVHMKSEVKDAFAFADILDEDEIGYEWVVRSNLPLKVDFPNISLRRSSAIKCLISIAECVNSGDVSQENLVLIMKKWLPKHYFMTIWEKKGYHRDVKVVTPIKDPDITRFCEDAKTYEEISQCKDLKKKEEEERKKKYDEMECYEVGGNDFCEPKWDLSIINKISSIHIKSGRLRSKTFLLHKSESIGKKEKQIFR